MTEATITRQETSVHPLVMNSHRLKLVVEYIGERGLILFCP